MYGYNWLGKDNLFELSIEQKLQKELRPVFCEEIKLLGLDCFLKKVPTDNEAPFLWAEGIRRYIIDGKCVAEAQGGGFYSMPTIKVLTDKKFNVKPIDIEKLWNLNASLMDGLIQKSLAFIKQTYEEYSKHGYKFVVAFSGGKDSLVLLDLVQRSLAPDQFIVVFGDTGMEFKDTYLTVEKVKELYPNLNFHTAKSEFPATESWKLFGPPGRRLRWCCAIHKSVPTLQLLRKSYGTSSLKAVVFDGVRKEESAKRATYTETAEGQKHINQINARPILEWNSAELYLYLLKRNILLNKAYKYGMSRVGCALCPMSAGWRDAIGAKVYASDISPFLSIVEEYAERNKGKGEVKKYVESVKWGARMGGAGLENAHERVFETIQKDTITFLISEPLQDWLNVASLLGPIVERNGNNFEQNIRGKLYNISLEKHDNGLRVSYIASQLQADRFAISWLRGVANKVAFCVGCETCCVECPTGAFTIDENKKINIITNKCVHCAKCISELNKSCWRAFALHLPQKGKIMFKGMDRYKGFGLRLEFLEHFFDLGADSWDSKTLGNLQYDALRVWLKEAGILDDSSRNGTITEIGNMLISLGCYNPLTWAILWVNLAYRSSLVRWYLFSIPAGESYERNDLIGFISDDDCPAERTKSNAVGTITDTFNSSPIGDSLEMGIPITIGKTKKYLKQGWSTPDPWALLYALYLYAEKIGNHYDFTLRELFSIGQEKKFDLPAVDPITIFALNPDHVKELFRDLSTQYPKFIKTSFVAGLDNIQLDPNISSLDVLKQATQEA